MKIHQKNRFLITFLIVPILLISSKSIATTPKKETTNYSITITRDNPKVARIDASFILKDSTLYMGWGASKLPDRWATFVHNLKISDSQNQPVNIEALGNAKWKVMSSLEEEITLSYEVHLDHEEYQWSSGIDAVAYASELGIFYTGRTLFILNGEEREHIIVTFNIPEEWQVTNPWSKMKSHKNTYQGTSITDLITALVFVGRHKEIAFKREGFELVFALGSTDIINQEEELKDLAQGVLDYYIELMGGVPNPSPDNPLSKSVVVISSSEKTDGEAMGNNISVLIEKDGDALSKTFSRFIFAHEFFHLWCGKSFSPAKDDTEWFKEGFTNYYTLKALHHINFLNDDSYLDFLSTFFYKRYNDDEGVGMYSMANGERKHEHWGLVYAGGMLVGISQDIIIRHATDNKKSIDDLMRRLFNKYGGSNNTYTFEELQHLITELSGIDQTGFFNTYVLGTTKIPIDTYLTLAGLDAVIDSGQLTISKNKALTSKQVAILNGLFGQFQRDGKE